MGRTGPNDGIAADRAAGIGPACIETGRAADEAARRLEQGQQG
jgi:hypothetical protein